MTYFDNNRLILKMTQEEKGYFSSLYEMADSTMSGKLEGKIAANFLKKSGLPKEILKKIWLISAQTDPSFIEKDEFYVALRLVALAQNNLECSAESIRLNHPIPPLPKFDLKVDDTSSTFSLPKTSISTNNLNSNFNPMNNNNMGNLNPLNNSNNNININYKQINNNSNNNINNNAINENNINTNINDNFKQMNNMNNNNFNETNNMNTNFNDMHNMNNNFNQMNNNINNNYNQMNNNMNNNYNQMNDNMNNNFNQMNNNMNNNYNQMNNNMNVNYEITPQDIENYKSIYLVNKDEDNSISIQKAKQIWSGSGISNNIIDKILDLIPNKTNNSLKEKEFHVCTHLILKKLPIQNFLPSSLNDYLKSKDELNFQNNHNQPGNIENVLYKEFNMKPIVHIKRKSNMNHYKGVEQVGTISGTKNLLEQLKLMNEDANDENKFLTKELDENMELLNSFIDDMQKINRMIQNVDNKIKGTKNMIMEFRRKKNIENDNIARMKVDMKMANDEANNLLNNNH